MASTGHLDSQREAAEKALDTQKVQTVDQGTINILHAVVCRHVLQYSSYLAKPKLVL